MVDITIGIIGCLYQDRRSFSDREPLTNIRIHIGFVAAVFKLVLKQQTEVQQRLGDEARAAIKNKMDGIEKMNEEDFDTFIIMIKSLRRTLLEGSEISYKCSRCGTLYRSKSKFCSNCGFDISKDGKR